MAKKCVIYAADAWGYICQVWEGFRLVDEYHAGNHIHESQTWVNPGSESANTPEELLKMARESALEMAKEWKTDNVAYDDDLEGNLKELHGDEERPSLFNSEMVVLNDGETFTGMSGCVVCQYYEQDFEEDHEAKDVIQALKDEEASGRMLDIATLVKLYDLVVALDPDDADLFDLKNLAEKVER